MSEEEIRLLIEIKCDMERSISQVIRTAFQKMEELIETKNKQNAKHYHFKTRKEMEVAMLNDFNPYSTFSFGKEPTK